MHVDVTVKRLYTDCTSILSPLFDEESLNVLRLNSYTFNFYLTVLCRAPPLKSSTDYRILALLELIQPVVIMEVEVWGPVDIFTVFLEQSSGDRFCHYIIYILLSP